MEKMTRYDLKVNVYSMLNNNLIKTYYIGYGVVIDIDTMVYVNPINRELKDIQYDVFIKYREVFDTYDLFISNFYNMATEMLEVMYVEEHNNLVMSVIEDVHNCYFELEMTKSKESEI